ncbi:hypothetical protein C8F04DRAFT_1124887 [Mycena alexandri]|uniref:Uncharacterized protein n=1 Tax=Mycena alexandri TaxID=1745969 RepID=A0AAD6SEZ1_9AGAR|nr:hypothetical protein C8F04DRAFT_1124887 [Mycena alexandri]
MVLNPIRIHSLLVMIVVILQSSTRFHLRLGLDLHRDSPILANRNPTDNHTPYPTTHEAHFIKTPPSIIKPFISFIRPRSVQ